MQTIDLPWRQVFNPKLLADLFQLATSFARPAVPAEHLLGDIHPVLAELVGRRSLLTAKCRAVTSAVNEQRERRDVLKANHYGHAICHESPFGNKLDPSPHQVDLSSNGINGLLTQAIGIAKVDARSIQRTSNELEEIKTGKLFPCGRRQVSKCR